MTTQRKPTYLEIHWGTTFSSKSEYFDHLENYTINIDKVEHGTWRSHFKQEVQREYRVLMPAMPSRMNADYEEWKVYFEKFLPHLDERSIIAWTSLGGWFLVKYFSENVLKSTVGQVHLLAPAIVDVPQEKLYGFLHTWDLGKIAESAREVHIFHSLDDPLCPYEHSLELHKEIEGSILHTVDGYGHLSCREFTEYVDFMLQQ